MEPTNDSVAQQSPYSFNHHHSGGNSASAVLGFLVSNNQFNVLQPAVSQSQIQNEDGLIDPRSTRLSRLQAAQRAEDEGTVTDRGVPTTVTVSRDAQGTFDSDECVEPVASKISSQFFHSLSVSAPDILESQSGGPVQNLLESGAMVDDALYKHDVNDVACMDGTCNKRISVAGPERSAGRPGHTLTRRRLACKKL